MRNPVTDDARTEITRLANALGFDSVGFTSGDGDARVGLRGFLDKGYHGDMTWLAEAAERRSAPMALWPGVRSVIALGMNYGPARNPLGQRELRDRGNVSVYARGEDYHKSMKRRLKRLAGDIHRRFGAEVKVFVDTAPVMEKPLAQTAGLGWQGKHTNLVSRDFGSWLFLGEIFTTLDLAPSTAEADRCGSCRACIEICPTDAFPAPYRLDARRCISYLTMEYKGHIPRQYRVAMGNRIYGCDDCLAVCPWNKFARRTRHFAFAPRAELTAPRLADLASLDEAGFRQVFAGSPIKRTGRDRFVRNVVIALGNSGDRSGVPAVLSRLADGSPLVRAMAVWALLRLATPDVVAGARHQHLAEEKDDAVRAEWNTEAPSPSPGQVH